VRWVAGAQVSTQAESERAAGGSRAQFPPFYTRTLRPAADADADADAAAALLGGRVCAAGVGAPAGGQGPAAALAASSIWLAT
jgi:hypothetical protein